MPAEGQQTQRQQYMYPHAAPTIPQQVQPTKAAHQGLCILIHYDRIVLMHHKHINITRKTVFHFLTQQYSSFIEIFFPLTNFSFSHPLSLGISVNHPL